MIDQQLYIAIVANFGMMSLGFTLTSTSLNKGIDDLRSDLTGPICAVELLTGKVYDLMGSK